MALAGIASAETYVEYDFTGTSPLNATIGTGGMQVYGSGHTVSDGDLIMGTADGFYSSAGANKAIYENTELDSWSLSLTATLIGGQTCYSVLQFGSTDYTSNKTAFSFYMGNGAADRGLFGFQWSEKDRYGVVMDTKTQQALGIVYNNVETVYTISMYDNTLHLSINGIDVTSYIQHVNGGTTTLEQQYQTSTHSGIALAKLGYANEVKNGSNPALGKAPESSTFHNLKIHTIPEPTTATLSLLALAGLAARRRRK